MADRWPRPVTSSLVLALAMLLVAPAVAMALAPATTLLLSPPVPDGSNGWWRTSPEAFASVDQDSVVHYDWGSGEETLAVTSGSPESLGYAPEGSVNLIAFAVNSAEETGTGTAKPVKTDTVPPDQPGGLIATPQGGKLSLEWQPVADATSGLAYYTVYRNLTGPPFSASDAIAAVTSTSCPDDPGVGVWYYAVRATDGAGNDSLMSDAVHASADVTPPSLPGDVEAWRNGRGFIRVTWGGSPDTETGVSHYTVARSVGGADALVLGSVPAGVTFFDDLDPEAHAADDVAYFVIAADLVGNESTPAGPAPAGYDLVAPAVPQPPIVDPIPDMNGSFRRLGTDMSVRWAESADAGSGVFRYELVYGEDGETPSDSLYFPLASVTYMRSASERREASFRIRVEDRAGNFSETSDVTEQRAVTVDRIDGPDRIHTALAVVDEAFPSSHAVVFASAYSFPDALAASGLAGALDAPIVLVGPGPLPADTLAALAALGAEDGWVIGGPPAVSAVTFGSIETAMSGETTRVAGPDRYRTAAAVASAVTAVAGTPERAYLVSGVAFPDALSVGPAAYAGASPVLFATPTGVPQTSLDALHASGAPETVIVGGTSAVWSGADALLPGPRVEGTDRYKTSKAFADWAVTEGLLTADRPLLVTGASFPDGLAAAPLGGVRSSPVLLVRRTSLDQAAGFLGAHLGDVQRVSAIGSEIVIDYGVMYDAWDLFTLPGF